MIQEGGGERARGGKRIEDERKKERGEEDRGDAGRGGFGQNYEGEGRKLRSDAAAAAAVMLGKA